MKQVLHTQNKLFNLHAQKSKQILHTQNKFFMLKCQNKFFMLNSQNSNQPKVIKQQNNPNRQV